MKVEGGGQFPYTGDMASVGGPPVVWQALSSR